MSHADFAEAFREAIGALGYGETPERRLSSAEVSELAMQRAGTRDRRSRAYKSARRTLERRRTTTARERRGQAEQRFAALLRRRGLNVYARLEIDPSPDPNDPDMREREIDITLRGRQLAACADRLEVGEVERAAEEFWRALMRAYEEVPEGRPSFLEGADIGDVAALELSWPER